MSRTTTLNALNTVTAALATVVVLATSASAVAATSTTDFEVRVTITSTCDVGVLDATDVDFGSVNSTATNTTATGQLNVRCTHGTAYTVALDQGDNASGGSRRMAGAGNYVPYGLFHTAGTSQPWSDQPAERHSGLGTGSAQQISVFGVMPSANFPAGAYADTVTATLTY